MSHKTGIDERSLCTVGWNCWDSILA